MTNDSKMPKRIQRKRTKGWRMPHNTVYVGRPTKWGNPYRIGDMGLTRETVIEAYENYLRRVLVAYPDFLDELRGKDLACWCPLDKPCHADVILKILKERLKTMKICPKCGKEFNSMTDLEAHYYKDHKRVKA